MLAVQVQYLTYLENKRHNVVQEKQGQENLNIQRFNADTSRLALNESVRHNQQTEELGFQTLAENVRHNTAMESETFRHNVASEDIGRLQAQASLQQAAAATQNAATNASQLALGQEKWKEEQKLMTAQRQKASAEAGYANERMKNEAIVRPFLEWEKFSNIVNNIIPF